MATFPDVLSLTHGMNEIVLCCPAGANHLDKGQPCQDACMASQQFYRGYPYTLLAVADGHGGAAYTRSDVGAHLAVEAVRDVALPFVHLLVELLETRPACWRGEAAHEFRSRFAKKLWYQWERRVTEHAADHPDDQLASEAHSKTSIRRYGTTVAMALFFESVLFVGAIGDSNIYILHGNTQHADLMCLQQDSASGGGLGLSTPSLSSSEAPYAWKTMLRMLDFDNNIEMVVLTTDGMPDSLKYPLVSIQDLYAKTSANGLDWLKQILPKQLRRWSHDGVGDDMAVIVCFPKGVVPAPTITKRSSHDYNSRQR